MTQPPESGDSSWLDTLAGKPADAADPKEVQQASALRAALKARSNALNQQVPAADSAQYQQLLFRLRREGLGSKQPIWKRPASWAIAASLVLGVSLVVGF